MVLGTVAALVKLDSRPRHERSLTGDTIVAVEPVPGLSICEEKIYGGSEHAKECDVYTKACLHCYSPCNILSTVVMTH
jgi:hypothetical protein